MSGLGAVLAAFALLLQVSVPQGLMVSREAGAVPLVICTGHGPLRSAADLSIVGRDRPGKAPASAARDDCLFAGHVASAAAAPPRVRPPVGLGWSMATFGSRFAPAAIRPSVAPPPPSQGPPALV